MGAEVKKYHTYIYGGPSGYQTNRSQFILSDDNGKAVAYIRFNDPGMDFENDYVREQDGMIIMHLPSTMFQSVLDILRNEKPVYVYSVSGRGFLTTSREPVGEGED